MLELDRRFVLRAGAFSLVSALGNGSLSALAQTQKDSVTLAMILEPPSLDPTSGAASAIAEIVLYNVFETLTKINSDASVSPLLAQSWDVSPDLQTYTFKLRENVRFHNGQMFDASCVKFSFERAASEKSTNKDKRFFTNLKIQVIDALTVSITHSEIEPNFLFLLGQASASIVEPKSAETNNTKPIGTGPYVLDRWQKGASVRLNRFDNYWQKLPMIRQAVFRFMPDEAAQTAALLAGDVDAIARTSPRSVTQFKNNAQFQVIVSGSLAKTILAINNKRKPLNDVRVRKAIAAAIDRKTVIEGAAEGFGVPIGSHYAPTALGYVDTTQINPFDVERAKIWLKDAKLNAASLSLNLVLPPTPYARQGGEIIASQLAKIGISLKLQNVEWAQWLNRVHAQHDYDLTLISHVEPFDLVNFTNPKYYWGYESEKFNALFKKINQTAKESERVQLLGEAQKLLAEDCVHAFLYQPQWITIAKKQLKGLWTNMPIFVNDLSALSW